MTELEMPESLAKWSAAASSARIGEPRNTRTRRPRSTSVSMDRSENQATCPYLVCGRPSPRHSPQPCRLSVVRCPLKYALVEFSGNKFHSRVSYPLAALSSPFGKTVKPYKNQRSLKETKI